MRLDVSTRGGVLKWTIWNMFPDMVTPVTSMGPGQAKAVRVSLRRGSGKLGSSCMVRSKASLDSPVNRQTDTTENSTFP